jgi:AraC-like DNA-binding protein
MPTVQRAGSGATVTGIATLCGFSDLGRFAVRFRQLYGQPPLQTLRQAAQSVAPPLNRRTTS